jgi:hypothetical protein
VGKDPAYAKIVLGASLMAPVDFINANCIDGYEIQDPIHAKDITTSSRT